MKARGWVRLGRVVFLRVGPRVPSSVMSVAVLDLFSELPKEGLLCRNTRVELVRLSAHVSPVDLIAVGAGLALAIHSIHRVLRVLNVRVHH